MDNDNLHQGDAKLVELIFCRKGDAQAVLVLNIIEAYREKREEEDAPRFVIQNWM